MIETYKFRLYPNEDQKVLLAKHFGSVRFVYNWALEFSQQHYKTNGKYLGWMTIASSKEYHALKSNNEWMKEINSQSLQNSIGHLGRAFENFFNHRGGFPKFKSKHVHYDSFEVPTGLKLDFKHGKIQIPKFLKQKKCDNRIKCIFSRKVKHGKIGTAAISKNPSGQYFVSFIVHTDGKYPEFDKQISKENSLGIDFGLKHFLNLSNGEKIHSPVYFKQSLDKLKFEQKKLSKKQKGSKNKEKQRIKVARVHQHIANQRQDFLHKLTTGLVKESQFDCFCLEDLNLEGMKGVWGRKVSDLSYYTFQSMLEYKCQKYGKKMIKIGRFEPSSQICSCCGHRQKLSLNDRVYICYECGLEIDRDINAALNIRDFGIVRNVRKDLTNTEGSSGINACGVGSSGKHDVNCVCETTDNEARKFPGNHLESHPSSVDE